MPPNILKLSNAPTEVMAVMSLSMAERLQEMAAALGVTLRWEDGRALLSGNGQAISHLLRQWQSLDGDRQNGETLWIRQEGESYRVQFPEDSPAVQTANADAFNLELLSRLTHSSGSSALVLNGDTLELTSAKDSSVTNKTLDSSTTDGFGHALGIQSAPQNSTPMGVLAYNPRNEPTNAPPVFLQNPQAQIVIEDNTASFQFSALQLFDPEGSALSFSSLLSGSALPAWVQFDPTQLRWTVQADNAAVGQYTIRLLVADSQGAVAYAISTWWCRIPTMRLPPCSSPPHRSPKTRLLARKSPHSARWMWMWATAIPTA